MRKKVILIVTLAVLVAFGTIFAVLNIHAPGKLSTWQKMEIEYRFQKQFDREWGPWDDEITLSHEPHARYYGSDNGSLILFKLLPVTIWELQQETIGEYVFQRENGQYFDLFVYRNGEFLYLKDAYEQGLISDAAVEAALKIHREYEK